MTAAYIQKTGFVGVATEGTIDDGIEACGSTNDTAGDGSGDSFDRRVDVEIVILGDEVTGVEEEFRLGQPGAFSFGVASPVNLILETGGGRAVGDDGLDFVLFIAVGVDFWRRRECLITTEWFKVTNPDDRMHFP